MLAQSATLALVAAALVGLAVTTSSGVARAAGTTITVTSTADSGAGSLRAAITTAETTPDDDTIVFDGSVFTSGTLHTITLASTLPTITKDNTTQKVGFIASHSQPNKTQWLCNALARRLASS
jgi:hypothetical protein